ncbi:MAG TPA: N-acetylneuraminate synthase family protein [Candidatus Eisenbacteria bacterium]|nr:N-acetylneuraminate synthase family protein [Candidatus Eisenbacteria bacterium]
MRIALGERALGADAPALVVAEIGSNHDGSLERALALVDLAARAGADGVQFHSFHAAALPLEPGPDGGSVAAEVHRQLERAELRTEWHAPLRERALARGLVFLSIAFDAQRAELLAALGVPAIAVASRDLGRAPLLRTLGGFGRPLLLATGGAAESEIAAALAAIGEGAGAPSRRPPVVLVAGPDGARSEDADLRTLGTLRTRFGCPVGWTDRSPGSALALGAVTLGACFVVKGLTDDRGRRGPDHATALEPGDLAAVVRAVRELGYALRPAPRNASGVGREGDVPAAAKRGFGSRAG